MKIINEAIRFTREEKTLENLNKVLSILEADTWKDGDKNQFISRERNKTIIYNYDAKCYYIDNSSIVYESISLQEFFDKYEEKPSISSSILKVEDCFLEFKKEFRQLDVSVYTSELFNEVYVSLELFISELTKEGK